MSCPNCGQPLFHDELPLGQCGACHREDQIGMEFAVKLGRVATNMLPKRPLQPIPRRG